MNESTFKVLNYIIGFDDLNGKVFTLGEISLNVKFSYRTVRRVVKLFRDNNLFEFQKIFWPHGGCRGYKITPNKNAIYSLYEAMRKNGFKS